MDDHDLLVELAGHFHGLAYIRLGAVRVIELENLSGRIAESELVAASNDGSSEG